MNTLDRIHDDICAAIIRADIDALEAVEHECCMLLGLGFGGGADPARLSDLLDKCRAALGDLYDIADAKAANAAN